MLILTCSRNITSQSGGGRDTGLNVLGPKVLTATRGYMKAIKMLSMVGVTIRKLASRGFQPEMKFKAVGDVLLAVENKLVVAWDRLLAV